MPEIGTSGLMSGDGKRGDGQRPKPPRPSSTLPGTWSLDFAMFFAPRKLGAHLNRETGNVSFDRQLAAYIRGLESTTRPRRHQTTAGTHDDPDYRPVQLFNDQTPSIAWARPPMLHLETRGRAMRRSAPFPRIRSRARPTGVIPRAREERLKAR